MKKKEKIKKSNSGLPNLVFYGLLVLLFYPPFFRGLFFDKELLVTHVITAMLFLAFVYVASKKTSVKLFNNPMDYAVIGLMLAYILAAFNAVIIRDAVREILKLVNYIFIYYMVSYFVAKKDNNVNMVITSIYASGVMTALFGLLAATNLIEIEGAIIANRLSSVFGYPNTFAAYLSGIFILGLYLVNISENRRTSIIYSCANYFIVVAFLLAQSRGALLMLPITLILFLVGPLRHCRLNNCYQIFTAGIPALLVSSKMLSNISGNFSIENLAWIAGGLLAVCLLNLPSSTIGKMVNGVTAKKKIIVGALGLVVIFGLMFATLNNGVGGLERLRETTLEDRNIVERLVFNKDAFKVIKDYPIFGTGGGGWGAIYREYQSHVYFSRAVHNGFLQTWVETGTIGFVFFIGIWLLFIGYTARLLKNLHDGQRLAIWAVFTTGMTIGLHSLIDFTLMFGSISLVVWSFFGIIRGSGLSNDNRTLEHEVGSSSRVLRVFVFALTIIVIIISGSLLTGLKYGNEGVMLYQAGSYTMAEERLEKAIIFDPLNAYYPQALSNIWKDRGTKAQTDDLYRSNDKLDRAYKYADKAVRLDRGNPDVYINRAKILIRMGEYEPAIKDYETALKLYPLNPEGYEELASAYIRIGKLYMQEKKKEQATKCFEKVASLPDMVKAKEARLTPISRKLWNPSVPMLKVYPRLNEYVTEAETLLSTI